MIWDGEARVSREEYSGCFDPFVLLRWKGIPVNEKEHIVSIEKDGEGWVYKWCAMERIPNHG